MSHTGCSWKHVPLFRGGKMRGSLCIHLPVALRGGDVVRGELGTFRGQVPVRPGSAWFTDSEHFHPVLTPFSLPCPSVPPALLLQ